MTTWEIELGGEDVSLIATYRAQWSRILRAHPYTRLVAKMKARLRARAEPAREGPEQN